MNNADHTMSLTPPSEMNVKGRVGAFLTGAGLLTMLVAFMSASTISPWIVMALSGTMLVSAAILHTISRSERNILKAVLGLTGLAGFAFLAFKLNLQGWGIFAAMFGVTAIGAVLYFTEAFGRGPAGIKNNGIMHSSATRQAGTLSWMMAIAFTGFYVILYWFPDQLFGLVAAADPLYHLMTGNSSYYIDDNGMGHVTNQWFVYGLTYTIAILVMGYRYILKYRHNRYQVMRTLSVAFFQLILAFLLPFMMEALNTQQTAEFAPVVQSYVPTYKTYESAKNTYFDAKSKYDEGGDNATSSAKANLATLEQNYVTARTDAQAFTPILKAKTPQVTPHYFTYFWALDYDIIHPSMIEHYTGKEPWDAVHTPSGDGTAITSKLGFGTYGWFVILFALIMSTVGVVVLTYFFGKRWYCSWVCGCGGLAETAGDPFRQQSDKSLKAWRIERISIYSVLGIISVITLLLLVDWKFGFMSDGVKGTMKSGYGFMIGSMFAGVVGTGFYPILGSRVWCRFGCPQAAILGIIQKYFSRFRITTNGAQCISCGNCSTYCEMGIDVKAYAQRGQNIVRASCVGCGVCSAVCPRGVLNLENGPTENRINDLNPISFDAEEIKVKM